MRFFPVLLSALFFCTLGHAQQHRAALEPTLRPFYHGVASGDPTDSSMIIWTRVTPDSGNTASIPVYWQIATDTAFQQVVNFGKLYATPDNDFCVKADVCGLQPGRFYYYMFNALGRNSITARTKTAPRAGADNDSVRLAVVSCADYENGYFNAYESISNKNNVDAVVHLGDYIYEYETGGISINNPGRAYEPLTEIISLQDYRIRHSHYKLDPQLRRIHQLFPFITVWDDHETCNDAYRDGGANHQPNEGPYAVRKSNSTSTYFTWMPLRKPDPNDTLRIFRKLRYGKLLDLIMLDTRLYDRDEQDLASTNDSTHKLMGPVEMNWFLQQLSDTTTRWKIIGNQVMFAPLQVFGQPINADQWDGYNYERQKIENHILNTNVKDVVMLTGDIHTSWCNDVPGPNYNASTGAGSVCVEFVGTSVTSVNSPLPVGVGIIQSLNPHMKYIDLDHHGYYTLDVRKNRTQADYTFVETGQIGSPNTDAASYYVNHNERHLRPGAPIFNYPQNAGVVPSAFPNQTIGVVKITDQYLTVNENTSGTVNIIPNQVSCPAYGMVLIDPANHGATISLNGKDVVYAPAQNYSGIDTVIYAICPNLPQPICDTIYLFVQVNGVQNIDTVVVDLGKDTTYSACLSFDDIATVVSVTAGSVQHGLFSLSDTCFSYTPDSTFCGVETISFIGCDLNAQCDTVVYQFRINAPVRMATVNVLLNKNSNFNYCPVFDDLFCPPSNISLIKAPVNGTTQIIDSCLKYFPFYNFVGSDSLIIVGCDTCGLNHCDTIKVVYQIQDPSFIESARPLVVLGVYPNPVTDYLYVQYALARNAEVEFSIYETNGSLVSRDKYMHSASGILYARLNASLLTRGVYLFEMKSGESVYSKLILKD